MSKQHDRITKKLQEQGRAWAVRTDKFIDPNDDFGAKPTYHVHPNASYPHQTDICRFDSLNEIEEWLAE